MKKYVDNFMQYRFLLSELVKKGIKLKYRRSYLGMIWSMLEPLLTLIVLTIVFGTLYVYTDRTFRVYILTGRLLYSFFSQSTKAALKSIRQNSAMIKKVYVPKYLFILARTFSSTINLLASFTALIVVMLAMRVELHYTVLLVWIPLAFIVAFSDLTDRTGNGECNTWCKAYVLSASGTNRTDTDSCYVIWMRNDSGNNRCIFQRYGISLVCSTYAGYVYMCDFLLS